MNMRQKLRCILTIMGIITVCTACIVQKDPVDNSDDSGTKKKSFGKYDIMKGWSESDYSRDEKYVYVAEAYYADVKVSKFEKYYELPNLYSLTFIIEMDKIYPNGDGLTTMMWE